MGRGLSRVILDLNLCLRDQLLMTLAKLELLEPCLMEAQLAGSGHCMPHHGHGSWSAEERRKVSNFHIVDRSCVRRI